MLVLKKVAVTGGLACGKSLACRFFQDLGAYVVSADNIVHQLLSIHTTVGQQVIELLGNDILINGEIDRKTIAKCVFDHPKRLKLLESILHPEVLNEIEKQYQEVKIQNKAPLFVAEVPLLFEIGAEKLFDITIAITADKNTCTERFVSLTRQSRSDYDKRMSVQLPQEEKARRATYVINNTGSAEDMQHIVNKLFYTLTPFTLQEFDS